ncbi:hypothetical protein SNE40_004612 [Patella caerulea]|uniref:Uncharacterized protein n=1 Tax=Patella caerulea TaxID=87958 RepID=A0AAN8PXE2_PATCE
MCKKCDKRHSTVLHQEQPAIINGLINTNSSAISLPILAVRIKSPDGQKFVDTMALQDSGSNATFCTEEIIKQLGIEGEKHQFSLTTMEKEDSPTESSIMSLNIFDLQEENFIELHD